MNTDNTPTTTEATPATPPPMTPEDILATLQKKLDAMPNEFDVPLGWTQTRLDAHLTERNRLFHLLNALRSAQETLAEVEPVIATLTKQRDDLEVVREKHCERLLACSPRSRNRAEMDKAQGEKLSIYAVDGRVDLNSEALPSPFPLFVELSALGYQGPSTAPWNPMASMYGSLPSIKRRLEQLEKRRVEAQAVIDAARRAAAV